MSLLNIKEFTVILLKLIKLCLPTELQPLTSGPNESTSLLLLLIIHLQQYYQQHIYYYSYYYYYYYYYY